MNKVAHLSSIVLILYLLIPGNINTTVYSCPSQYHPSQYRFPPNTAAHFKSQIGFFKVILSPNTAVSEYRQFFWEGQLY